MKRILISQNDINIGNDYIVADGELINEEDSIIYYTKEISKSDNWKTILKDEYIVIKKEKNNLVIKSIYQDKDEAGRYVYYIYLIEDFEGDFETILEYLDNDSKIIKRNLNRTKILEIIKKDKESKKKKSLLFIAAIVLSIGIVMALLIFFLKIKNE